MPPQKVRRVVWLRVWVEVEEKGLGDGKAGQSRRHRSIGTGSRWMKGPSRPESSQTALMTKRVLELRQVAEDGCRVLRRRWLGRWLVLLMPNTVLL